MAKFFINRPIVAMVISILMVIVGVVAMVQLPVALYPNIAPPEILLTARYPGADAVTLEQSVATPIEQQMSGVDKMLYMYSLNQSAGSQMQLRVDFDVTTDPSVDQVLTNLRYSQAASQLPPDVVNQGVSVTKSVTSPLGLFVLYSPKGTYDPLFLANYAYVNINDPMTRVPGIGQVQIFGASQYAIRLWVNPDTLAKLDITVNEIASALQAQNTVNPAGQLGGDPIPRGQEFTYTVLAQGRLKSLAEFENVVVRAKPDGALVRIKDVARVELGAQNYIRRGRHRDHEGGDEADGGDQGQVPRRPGLRHVARHDLGGQRGDPRDREDARRGARPGRPRRLHLLAGLPRDAHPAAGGAGRARRRVHGLSSAGILDQHAVALRPRAGHRPRGGRRHRGRRGRRATHRAGPLPARRGAEGDGRGVGTGRGHRPRHGRGVHPDGVHPGHHRPDVSTVRGHHRGVRAHLGLQRPYAEPGALGPVPAAEARDARPARVVLPWVQPRLRAGDGRVS